MFFELSHQASVRLRSRLVYFADPKLAILHTGTDTPDRGLIGLSRIAPLQIEDSGTCSLRDSALQFLGILDSSAGLSRS